MIPNTLLRRLAWLLSALLLTLSAVARADVRVGDAVPAFDTRLLNGKTLAYGSLKRRPVVITFWATWCPPCHQEMIELQQLYERYHGQGLEVIAISVNTERAQVVDYLKSRGFTYPVAMSMPRHGEIFGPMLFPPRLFLIDSNGKLVLSHWGPIRFEALEATVKAML